MKRIVLIMLIGFSLVGCKKEEIPVNRLEFTYGSWYKVGTGNSSGIIMGTKETTPYFIITKNTIYIRSDNKTYDIDNAGFGENTGARIVGIVFENQTKTITFSINKDDNKLHYAPTSVGSGAYDILSH